MKYKTIFEPDDGGWLVRIPSVQGCHTWARTLATARKRIRDALFVSLDDMTEAAARVEAAKAELVEDIRIPATVRRALLRQKAAVAKSQAETKRVAKLTEEAAVALTRTAGLSLRDAGDLLNISHSRVDQILKTG
jgi:predicted RNase H-like HicB family nuclease